MPKKCLLGMLKFLDATEKFGGYRRTLISLKSMVSEEGKREDNESYPQNLLQIVETQ